MMASSLASASFEARAWRSHLRMANVSRGADLPESYTISVILGCSGRTRASKDARILRSGAA